eukprot:TRINITY_DN14069_c0_g1_i1.p1 TRINITY_DN14069_c0_g1~~TRINITY_DN14069_c0_g1_i1.p1  ORF type:complete len:154 (+),score=45.83 TRINITY_DN14069_c0_g1_i1:109-570(+)
MRILCDCEKEDIQKQVEEGRLFSAILDAEEGYQTALQLSKFDCADYDTLKLIGQLVKKDQEIFDAKPEDLLDESIEDAIIQSLESMTMDSIDFTLGDNSEAREECKICLEKFEAGQEATRMGCFCLYHTKCIKGWWKDDRKGCTSHGPKRDEQ